MESPQTTICCALAMIAKGKTPQWYKDPLPEQRCSASPSAVSPFTFALQLIYRISVKITIFAPFNDCLERREALRL